MTLKDILNLHGGMCDKARILMEKKSADYSGGQQDALTNFKSCQMHGVNPVSGLVVRLNDKLMRLSSFTNTGTLHVKSESVQDTLIDIINYAVLAAALIKDSSLHVIKLTEKDHVDPDPEKSFDLQIAMQQDARSAKKELEAAIAAASRIL